MSIAEFDFSELKEYADQIAKLDEKQRETLMEDCTKQVAAALLTGVIKRTPVGVYDDGRVGGTLRRGWTGGISKGAKSYVDGQRVTRIGNSYQLTEQNVATADNGVFYASYVEYGHRQTPGRYVPVLGKSLKASWVEGHHMLKMAEEDVNRQQGRIISKKVEKELEKYFGGGG